MKLKTINEVTKLARELISRGNECVEELREQNEALAKACNEFTKNDNPGYITGTAKSGALRRTSLELTRALAKLRKPS